MTEARVEYAEDRAALRPVVVLSGVGLPIIVVLAAVAGGATGQEGYLFPAAIALLLWIFTGSMYIFVHWPTGLRIDADGVRIGNVRRPGANRRHRPAPSFQAYRVFEVGWPGVLSMRVTRDRRELRRLAKESRRATSRGVRARGGMAVGFALGMLTPPMMRAALVLEIDEQYARFPEFRVRQAAAIATSQVGTRSGVWVCPTRQPDRLAEVIGSIVGSSRWNARRM
ncbi:MAG TPA: hypothetical protein VG756_06730 [Pseudonocardiaceae bacterium]|jgi:hypothetical protein|nr:hypothetical protein [Pseudonocardiaceae bacterium]